MSAMNYGSSDLSFRETQGLHCTGNIMRMCKQAGHYQGNDKKTVVYGTHQ